MVDEGFVTVGSIMGSRIYRCSSESGGEEEGARDERWPVETPSLSKLGVMSDSEFVQTRSHVATRQARFS